MLKILKNAAQIVTVNTSGENHKRGKNLSSIDVLEDHAIVIEGGIIKDLIPHSALRNYSKARITDLKRKVVLPGLVECHTHTVFAGSRAGEFRQRINGVSYEEIAKAGGGINTTVKAVREAPFDDLVNLVKPRIDNFIAQGVTTLEIKSGYGLDCINEIKLLNVIKHLNKIYPIDIVPAFLGAHTYPNELKGNHRDYIDEITKEMIPFIAQNELAVFCDGFCEKTAFSAEEIDYIFSSAEKAGLKIKLHTEQFNNIGGLDIALKHNAVSVDHLEVIKEEDIAKLSASDTTAVLLPGVSYFLNYDYAPARKLIDNNAIVALATDYNPGSSNICNIGMIMNFAAINMKMKVEEIISAYTINSANALALSKDRGSIELNKKADFAVYDAEDYSDIIYNAGQNLNVMTVKSGNIIYCKE